MLENSFSVLSIHLPFALIKVSLGRFPSSIPIFCSIFPLSLEHLSIVPLKGSISFSHSIHELSSVYSINILFTSLNFDIFVILSLKNISFSDHYTFAVLFFVDHLAEIDSFVRFYDLEVLTSYDLFHLEFIAHWFIIFEVSYKLIFFRDDKKAVLLLISKLLLLFFALWTAFFFQFFRFHTRLSNKTIWLLLFVQCIKDCVCVLSLFEDVLRNWGIRHRRSNWSTIINVWTWIIILIVFF